MRLERAIVPSAVALVLFAQPAWAAPLDETLLTPALRLTLGWLTFVVVLGLGVLVFAGRALDGVLETLEADVSRAFWIGVATQVAAVPVLVIASVLLAVTVVGLLAIPIVAAAWILALVGLVSLGTMATARLIGHGVLGSAGTGLANGSRARRDALRALLAGLAVLIVAWLAAAVTAPLGGAGVAMRGLALALTWVAATAGMGAAVLSRGGRRRLAPRAAPVPAGAGLPDWQTPTPVSGVVAARRPVRRDPVESR
jgi:hypothetical protein